MKILQALLRPFLPVEGMYAPVVKENQKKKPYASTRVTTLIEVTTKTDFGWRTDFKKRVFKDGIEVNYIIFIYSCCLYLVISPFLTRYTNRSYFM